MRIRQAKKLFRYATPQRTRRLTWKRAVTTMRRYYKRISRSESHWWLALPSAAVDARKAKP